MNLYNIFEGLENPKDNKSVPTDQKQTDYAMTTADMAKGELVNKLPRMLPTDRKDPMMGMQEEGVTEDSQEVIDEVAMNPKVFAQAIATGQEKGVLVGFEFETCIPKTSIERWKTGDQAQEPEVPRYDAESTAWVDGKTTDDLLDGIQSKANGRFRSIFEDMLKYKGSVASAVGQKKPYDHYVHWADSKIAEAVSGADGSKLTFEALAAMLKDPEVKQMDVRYNSNEVIEKYGTSDQYNGRSFTITVLKDQTGVDFGKRVPKAALTPELAKKVSEVMNWVYYKTNGPFDQRAQRVSAALERAKAEVRRNYYPPGGYGGGEFTASNFASMKQHFAEFCQETMGTTDLKELLKKKWAFRGRVNNTTATLKEKLWYYVTPNAPMPTSLAPRSYGRSDYKEGAEFLKANLKDVYGENMEIFTGYHQATKKLDRWYIEPDGSLRANGDDSTAEVVSPPLPAAEAMTALRTWYDKAQQLKLYTNSSTGLHINVSIPGNLDVLKLATFVGDSYVLKQFNRQDNSYARSVIKSLKSGGQLPTVGSKEFKDAENEMKELVKRISGDHFATVNFNGKYVSFRHAGGDYLNKGTDIANTVGRFVRAMIIASDPTAYRDEYISKLVKMMKSPEETGEKMSLGDIRQLAQKGIPTVNLDVVVRPRDPSNPTQQDIDDAITSIKRWARDQYSLDASITQDPSAEERLLNDRGFASSSKEWIESAPENMFLRVTVIPTTRRKLVTFADSYAGNGNQRGAAFSLYYDGKRATAIKYNELIKQDDPRFVGVIQALRGGAAKPLPLPGAKGTPSTAAATFASQRPAQQEPERTDVQRNGQRRDWIVYNPNNNPDGANPAHGVRRDNMNTTEIVQAVHEIEDRNGLARGTLRVRYADEPQAQQAGYHVVDEMDRIFGQAHDMESDALEAAQELANHRGRPFFVNDPSGERVGGARPEEGNQGMYRPLANDDLEQTYNIINTTDGDQIQHYHGTLADARRIAQARANQMGVTIGVEDQDGDAFGYFDPQTQNEGITSPGGSDNNDSTSPIHGNEADYDDNYQSMVARVGQKAREQERKKPVDLAKLAHRLRQADKTEITDEDIMESRLYAMKRAGYDIL